MLKPSWCLVVRTTYFMPALRAIPVQARASNFTGLKRPASCSYSRAGIFSSNMIHSE